MQLARRIANRSLDYLLFNQFLEPYWLNRMRGTVLCLLYHRVDEPGRHQFLTQGGIPVITPEELETDLRFLLDKGARFLTFNDLQQGGFPADDEIGIIVTFDDGFRDNYTTALEVLNLLGIKAVIFQSTAMVDSQDLIWEHALYWIGHDCQRVVVLEHQIKQEFNDDPVTNELMGLELLQYVREHISAPRLEELINKSLDESAREEQCRIAENIYPVTEQIRAALKTGHEIGSHGHHHYKRANIDNETFEMELITSRKILATILGFSPTCFSYPFNSRQSGDNEICSRYFQQVATVDGGFLLRDHDPLAIPRATWPGTSRNSMRRRRWLTTGKI